jgi:hypothetical protein
VTVEELEPRNLLSIFTPAQIRHAYGFDQVAFGSFRGDGSGQMIAIVDAYDDPRIASDLHTFDQTFGLADPTLTKATPQGLPATNAGWALEISLDVEWAHATAPGAKILLVEAKTSSLSNLLGAVDYARTQPGVSVVSMSWGLSEAYLSSSFEASMNIHFTTPAGHGGGVTFVAASGDDGGIYGPDWPAVSPNVLSVGGTSLNLDSQGNYLSESGWSDSSGGFSNFIPEPSYQRSVQNSGVRTTPDVAMVADPNSGLYVYTTVSQGGYTGFFQVGGTSAGAPIWSGLVAIADQGRALEGTTTATKSSLDGGTDTLPAVYRISSSDFHDVTTGGNAYYSAGPGYDLVTGRGSPKANLVIADLVKVSASGITTTAPSTTTTSGTTGSGKSGHRSDVVGGQNGQSSTNPVDASLAVALGGVVNPSFRTVSGVSPPGVAQPPASAAPAAGVAPLTSLSAAAYPLQNGGGSAAGEGADIVPADSNIDVVPPTPIDSNVPDGKIIPAAPTSPDSSTPEPPLLDELYDAAGTEEIWTAAFAGSDSLPSSIRLDDAETYDVTTSVAVALGGVWFAVAASPDQRKRPALSR